jgi:NAD(P)-dependent dehydrogenase (short-subunit alcohol dehydrogenase family)
MDDSSKSAIYPSLLGRSVVITGGASGIGESLVAAFVTQGARVAFLDRQADVGMALASRLVEQGYAQPAFHECDLTDVDALQRAVRHIVDAFGTVDVLVNNAGDDTRHRLEEVTAESWDRAIAINLKQQFFMIQGIVPAMRRGGGGSIINMSSIGWVIPSTGLPVYVAAKAAIVGMTRALAHELGGDNIRVNSVLPGAIQTERQKRLWLTEEYKREVLSRQALKRMLTPEDVARLVLFLAADDSSAITNQAYIVDGGWV